MKKEGQKIKATVRLYDWLWKEVQHRAIEEDVTAEAIVTRALVEHLKIDPNEIRLVAQYARRKKGGKS
jgi:hypothetical protein